jgi:hypothetical protein
MAEKAAATAASRTNLRIVFPLSSAPRPAPGLAAA